MSNYFLSLQAERDLEDINDYIAQINPEAANRLLKQIAEQLERLSTFPAMGRRWDILNPPLRSFPVEDYLIFYRPLENGIAVTRIVSGYQDMKNIFPELDEEL